MFSDRTLYALQLLVVLHSHTEAEPRTVDELAEETTIPGSFLAKIVGLLTRKGYLSTRPGPGGGVTVQMPAEELELDPFFREMGELTPVNQGEGDELTPNKIGGFFSEYFSERILSTMTLEDLVNRL